MGVRAPLEEKSPSFVIPHAIATQSDIVDAMKMLESHRNGHSHGHSKSAKADESDTQPLN